MNENWNTFQAALKRDMELLDTIRRFAQTGSPTLNEVREYRASLGVDEQSLPDSRLEAWIR